MIKGLNAKFLEAMDEGDFELVKKLRRLGARVSVDETAKKHISGHTALAYMAKSRQADWVEWLIKNGADVNIKTPSGETPLLMATNAENNSKVIKLLIDGGADVNARGINKRTPLILAAMYSDIKSIKVLIKSGADKNLKDSNGNAAVDYVKSNKIKKLLKIKRPEGLNALQVLYNAEQAKKLSLFKRKHYAKRKY